MERGRGPLVLFVAVLLSALLWIGFVALFNPGGFVGFSPGNPQCSDGLDNDADGFCDFGAGAVCTDGSSPGDADCYSATDDSENTAYFFIEGFPDDDFAEFYRVVFSERGDIFHYGSCGPYQGGCESQITFGEFFKIKNDLGEVMAWINQDGNICVSELNCDPEPDCETSGAAFKIKNDLGETVAYFNENGEVCYEGTRSDNVPTVVFDLP